MSGELASPPSPFIAPGETYQSVERRIVAIALDHPARRAWWITLAAACGLLGILALSLGYLLWSGVGIWGNNIPVTWALDIVSYDWWIGIASGGLILSGAFLLLGVEWRSAVNRIAETTALIAAAAAAVYPIIHLGRPWFFYWNLPYPNTFDLWPQFRSPLFWDAVDIISYLFVCASFWYIGLLPDLASLRDRAYERVDWATDCGLLRAQIYGVLALGWRGSAVHWQRWSQAYRTVGLVGVLLVVSLQSGAAIMFAGTLEPGWHSTLLPVTFLVGAVLAGLGAVAVLLVVLRWAFALEGLVTARHYDVLAKLLLGFGLAALYCEASEAIVTALTGDAFDKAVVVRRFAGPHAWAGWTVVLAMLSPVHLFWFRRMRRSAMALAIVGLLVNVGAFADHFMVIVVTLQQDFLPSAFHAYSVGIWGLATFAGSSGLFVLLMLLFLRYLPALSILELRRIAGGTAVKAQRPEPEPEPDAPLWGISAEFASGGPMLAAAEALRLRDLGRVDIYTPVPLAQAARVLDLPRQPIHPFATAGAVLGGAAAMALFVYATAYDYPFDIGGRPRFSWPSFLVPSFSFAMLSAALAVHVALFVLNRLPRLNHPAFNIPGFARSTNDRFFVVVEASDRTFDPAAVESAFGGLAEPALAVARVTR